MPPREFNECIENLRAPMEEFQELAESHSCRGAEGQVIFTEALMRSLAGEGLAVIRHHARRGSLKAAMYLVDRCLGSPDQPFHEQVAGMSKEEAEKALFAEFKAQGFTDDVARGLVVAARRQPSGSD